MRPAALSRHHDASDLPHKRAATPAGMRSGGAGVGRGLVSRPSLWDVRAWGFSFRFAVSAGLSLTRSQGGACGDSSDHKTTFSRAGPRRTFFLDFFSPRLSGWRLPYNEDL